MKKKHSAKEWISLQVAKNPNRVILITILLLNAVFFIAAALVISALAPKSLQYSGFWPSVFYTISMILDAGCIQYVVADVGGAGVAVIVACLLIVLIGMITFTGAVIGYVTNYISSFIENANTGTRRLRISGHTVILNWNTRASEIVNDMLYAEEPEKVVVLASSGKEAIEREISERLADTLEKENGALREACKAMPRFKAWRHYRTNCLKNRVTVVVWEGDTFSTKKLNDISIKKAKAVIILGKDVQNTMCRLNYEELRKKNDKGNSDTIKTLIQVAEMTGAGDSADEQKVIVEIDDEWTLRLVQQIIAHKERLKEQKNNIVPVPVNRVLGQILSQFSIMPELNTVYGELFSNKGAAFYCEPVKDGINENAFIADYLKNHTKSIPLSQMNGKDGRQFFFIAESQEALEDTSRYSQPPIQVKLNPGFYLAKRNIVILGHNSKTVDIMNGFNSFRSEWKYETEELRKKYGNEVLNILVIDDKASLDKCDHYSDHEKYPYVSKAVEADVCDAKTICKEINAFVDASEGDTSILILSDDAVITDELDANALTYLIHVQNIISERREKEGADYDIGSIDVAVEILNPKNYDIVRSYSINNIVISNRYISKMVTQISEKHSIYEFYQDILTYDTLPEDTGEKQPEAEKPTGDEGQKPAKKAGYSSKELYAKPAGTFFNEMPPACTAAQLIRGVFEASPEENKAVVFGYTDAKTLETTIFSGDQTKIHLELKPEDKLILFAYH